MSHWAEAAVLAVGNQHNWGWGFQGLASQAKESGLYPKYNRKPLKELMLGSNKIWFVLQKGCYKCSVKNRSEVGQEWRPGDWLGGYCAKASQNWPNREDWKVLGQGYCSPCNALPTPAAPGSTRKCVVSEGAGADAEAASMPPSRLSCFLSKPAYQSPWDLVFLFRPHDHKEPHHLR